MAGRASKAGAESAIPEVPEVAAVAETPEPAAAGPFGKAATVHHGKEDAGEGSPVAMMQSRSFEEGYVEPGERSNPKYLKKLADEKAEAEKQSALRDKGRKAFRAQAAAQIFQPSPNSPTAKFETLY